MTGFRESAGGKTYTGSDGESDRPFAAEQSDLWSLDVDAPSSVPVGENVRLESTASFSGRFTSPTDPDHCTVDENTGGVLVRWTLRRGGIPIALAQECVPALGSRTITDNTYSIRNEGPQEWLIILTAAESGDKLAEETVTIRGESDDPPASYSLSNLTVETPFDTASDEAEIDDEIDVSVDITNTGGTQENKTLTWYIDTGVPLAPDITRTANTAVEPGNTTTFNTTWDISDQQLLPGTRPGFGARADGEDTGTTGVSIVEGVSASDIDIDCSRPPDEVAAGEEVSFAARVTNNATVAADVNVSWFVNGTSIASDSATVSAGGGATVEGGPLGYGAFETLVGAGSDATVTVEVTEVTAA